MKSLIIFKYIFKLWFAELTSIFNDSTKKIMALFTFLLSIILFGYLSFILIGNFIKPIIQTDDITIYDYLYYSESLYISFIVIATFILLKTLTSDNNILDWQLAWLPVRKNQVTIAYYILQYLIVLLIAFFIITVIYLPAFVYHTGFTLFLFNLILIGFLQTTVLFIILTALYNLITLLFSILNFKEKKILTPLIILGIIVIYVRRSVDLFAFKPENNILVYSATFFYRNLANTSMSKLSILLILALFFMITSILFQRPSNTYSIDSLKILDNLKMSKSYKINIIILQLKYMFRNMEVLINLFITIIIMVTSFVITDLESMAMIYLLFYVFSSTLHAMYSYGNERKFDYIYKLANKNYITINYIRLLTNVIFSLILYLLYYLYTFYTIFFIDTFILGLFLVLGFVIIQYTIGFVVVIEFEKPLNSFVALTLFLFYSSMYFGVVQYLYSKQSIVLYYIGTIILILLVSYVLHYITKNKEKQI